MAPRGRCVDDEFAPGNLGFNFPHPAAFVKPQVSLFPYGDIINTC